MKLTVLGSGTSTGVPIPGCQCAVCTSPDPRNKRLRTSAVVEVRPGCNLLIDASTDLRQQALRAGLQRVDAVLFTHSHADHVLGIDDLRAFNFVQRASIPCYGTRATFEDIQNIFSYIFNPDPDYLGGGVARLDLHEIDGMSPFTLFGTTVQPIPLQHGHMPVTGYRFGPLAYLTDMKSISEQGRDLLRGIRYLLVDGLRYEAHATHLTIPEACTLAQELGAERTWLIHMTHTIEHFETNRRLPAGIELAYDGLVVEF